MGTLGFNPAAARDSADLGKLYFSLGDGGQAGDPRGYGQSLREPLGAILRIDPLLREAGPYGIPQDNPFVSRAGVAPEIWAYGLRHPQQFSWDRDGRMFIADMGQEQIEEINLGIAGANYGWRLREGGFATAFGAGSPERPGPVYALPAANPAQFVDPVAQYDHDEGYAVGSGFVYRGQAIPALAGKYVFADLARGRLFYTEAAALRPGGSARIQELRVRFGGVERETLDVVGYPNTYRPGTLRADLRLGIDAAGELYLLTKGDGWVRKLIAPTAGAGETASGS